MHVFVWGKKIAGRLRELDSLITSTCGKALLARAHLLVVIFLHPSATDPAKLLYIRDTHLCCNIVGGHSGQVINTRQCAGIDASFGASIILASVFGGVNVPCGPVSGCCDCLGNKVNIYLPVLS